jgi:UDP-N-acetyl-D-galactosamine dehydrogenase
MEQLDFKNTKVAVMGLGYVGLPLAVSFAEKFKVVGYDIRSQRLGELYAGIDRNDQITKEQLENCGIDFTNDARKLGDSNFYIITVPTPVDNANVPDLTALLEATATVAEYLKKGDTVVYESTVYPGATEEECVPILEELSGLKVGESFSVGFSPERINPGDTEHGFSNITKVVSGDSEESLKQIAAIYSSVIDADIHQAPSIKVAETSKILENTQRDLNIGLINEMSLLCERLGIDTLDVLDAAATKWNFVRFTPGLVGGHCIGVDPYYLTYKAEQVDFKSDIVLSGRRVNDQMGYHIAQRTIKEIIKAKHDLNKAMVTILGLTFKANCPDIRNTKVVDVVRELSRYGVGVQVYDPLADKEEARAYYGVHLSEWDELEPANAIIIAVDHNQFKDVEIRTFKEKLKTSGFIGDIKGVLDRSTLKQENVDFWRL